jgi:hypothetical protein
MTGHTKREILKVIGSTGAIATSLSGTALAKSSTNSSDSDNEDTGYPATDYESALDRKKTEKLYELAKSEEVYRVLKEKISKQGYSVTEQVKAYHVKIPERGIEHDKIHVKLYSESQNTDDDRQYVRLIVRFKDEIESEAQKFKTDTSSRVIDVYYCTPQTLNNPDSSIITLEELLGSKQGKTNSQKQVNALDVPNPKVCKTYSGDTATDLCAAIGSAAFIGSGVISLIEPTAGGETVVTTLKTTGFYTGLAAGACDLAETIDGKVNCEPDEYELCARTFPAAITLMPLC